MRAAVNMQAALGVEHQFGKAVTLSATYINSHGVHQYLSNNINAYLPGTYDAATGTGTRPNGINENIYQYQSGGTYNQNQLMLNYTVRAKRVSLFGFYSLNYAKADTSGAGYFPSNPVQPKRRLRPRELRCAQPVPARRQYPGAVRRLAEPDAGQQFRPAFQHHDRPGPERR